MYRTLLGMPPVALAVLAERLECGAAEVAALVDTLEAKGLVSRVAGEGQRVVAAPPELAIEVLLLQRQEELQRARLEAARLSDTYRRAGQQRTAAELVEVVTGREAIAQRFEQLQLAAQHEVLVFDTPPYAVSPPYDHGTELAGLARGVRYRGLYDRQALDLEGAVGEISELTVAGEEARVLGEVPMKLAIADRSLALVPLAADQPTMEAGAALVHPCALLDALITLFESMWSRATPLVVLGGRVVAAGEGDEATAQLVSLMLAGLPDEAIARRLDTSTRTVQRRVKRLMDDFGAGNRLQLGWQLASRGLDAEGQKRRRSSDSMPRNLS